MSKKLKRLLLIISVLFSLIAIVLSSFLVVNEAPITVGSVQLDVLYKDELTLDIYTPTQQVYDKSPVVFYLHGGGWIGGIKESINFNRFNGAVNKLRSEGYYVISPEYTLATETHSPFPHCISDVFDVIEWASANADTYQFDTNNFGVFGESAGAHLAMMAAYCQKDSLENTQLNYVVDVYGPTDLAALYNSQLADSVKTILSKLPTPLEQKLDIAQRIFGFDPEEDTLTAQLFTDNYSPIYFARKNNLPHLIIHGTDDIVVPIEQSEELVDELSQYSHPYEYHVLEGVNHGFIGADEVQMDSVQLWVSSFIFNQYRQSD